MSSTYERPECGYSLAADWAAEREDMQVAIDDLLSLVMDEPGTPEAIGQALDRLSEFRAPAPEPTLRLMED